ncbi:hypothetical protein D5086_022382 [Populus alba]|uniref:Uncharacterized protein n=1 Tax=Populus alba TaxID=43335 RepID=A0ACC4BF89_POPAL
MLWHGTAVWDHVQQLMVPVPGGVERAQAIRRIDWPCTYGETGIGIGHKFEDELSFHQMIFERRWSNCASMLAPASSILKSERSPPLLSLVPENQYPALPLYFYQNQCHHALAPCAYIAPDLQ